MLLITWESVQRQMLSQWVWVGPELHVSVGGVGLRATPRADIEPGCTGVFDFQRRRGRPRAIRELPKATQLARAEFPSE